MVVRVVKLVVPPDDDAARSAVTLARGRHRVLVIVAPSTSGEPTFTVLEYDAVAPVREWSAAQHELDSALRLGGQPRQLDPTDIWPVISPRLGQHGRAEQRDDRGECCRSAKRSRARDQRSLRSHRAAGYFVPGLSSHSATPPCREHAPVWPFAWEKVPSLHFAMAPVGSVFFAFGAAVAGAGRAAGAVGAAVGAVARGGAGAGAGADVAAAGGIAAPPAPFIVAVLSTPP